MNFWKKFGNFLLDNIFYVIILVVALAYFLWASKCDVLAWGLATIAAVIVYFTVMVLWGKYKKMPAEKAAPAKPVAKKAPAKKVVKKKPAKKSKK